MGIADGFALWLGRILAEIAVWVAVFMLILVFVFFVDWRDRRAAKRRPAGNSPDNVRLK